MTTTSDITITGLAGDDRRARALRWLLTVTASGVLPMPKQIQFGEIECCGDTLYYLSLQLDNDTDLTGWPEAIHADSIDEFDVTSKTHQWTAVQAETTWRNDPGFDWNHIKVTTNHHYRPIDVAGGGQ
jgi:hypothetical protein